MTTKKSSSIRKNEHNKRDREWETDKMLLAGMLNCESSVRIVKCESGGLKCAVSIINKWFIQDWINKIAFGNGK